MRVRGLMQMTVKGHLVVMASALALHGGGGVWGVIAPCGCQGHSHPPWRPEQKAPVLCCAVLCWLGGSSSLPEIDLSAISQCDSQPSSVMALSKEARLCVCNRQLTELTSVHTEVWLFYCYLGHVHGVLTHFGQFFFHLSGRVFH